MSTFLAKLTAAVRRNNSLLCVGLDPDPYQFPAHFPAVVDAEALVSWGRRLIEQTADLVCCYKPNAAFYEQFGAAGWEALRQTIAAVPHDIPVILDAKRGDIGSTATAYARAAFEVLGADAVTVSPYLGRDAVAPFLAYPGKAVFVLAHTSNPSAAAIQELPTGEDCGQPLYARVVQEASAWGGPEQVAFVVGATQPPALAHVRSLLGDAAYWILAPGVGAQGGDLAAALAAGLDRRGSGLIVPVSRHVIYAADPRSAASALRNDINRHRAAHSLPSAPPVSSLILALHAAGCVQFGDFTLASGKRSPIYLDLRRLSGDPALLRQAAAAYAALLAPLQYERLAAVPYAALPIATAVALAVNKPLIYPRKEVKAHGTGQAIEGIYAAGERVAVVEDLVTTGGSVLTAVNTLRAAGLAVNDVVVLVDREQGGAQALAAAGCRLHAAFTLSQIVDTLEAVGRVSAQQAADVRRYLRESA
ncbi:MAG: orotidine-5'-phosphate decarboxylase [Caldilineales bacterium]|nr:orotidine-5'-phosphate decarboxylase [Caldilineales bacterium]MDW8316322.1 orotidine-5'-phosphate decarboxylase [Anaerolineae bacterium]